jgi:hypothetical protein
MDSSAFEVQIAAHHAPWRLELQHKLEQPLHAPDSHAFGQDRHSIRPTSARPSAKRTDACDAGTHDIGRHVRKRRKSAFMSSRVAATALPDYTRTSS